jgi:hypothetical protein
MANLYRAVVIPLGQHANLQFASVAPKVDRAEAQQAREREHRAIWSGRQRGNLIALIIVCEFTRQGRLKVDRDTTTRE